MLNLIEKSLRAEGFKYGRVDGALSIAQTSKALKRFSTDPKCTILLASIGSAGVGYKFFIRRLSPETRKRMLTFRFSRLDLTVACRVHLMEPQWNPMAEEQALDRVHRLGQLSEVITHRYIVKNSIEEVSFTYSNFGDLTRT